ncbi:hypothetical protein JCM10213_004515 [Rhodosporidiobolus nylandii]
MPAEADPRPLPIVRALLFDTFGTLTNWEDSISRLLEAAYGKPAKEEGDAAEGAREGHTDVDWLVFTRQWRAGYMKRTREIASGGSGPGNIDDLHLEILNSLLDQPGNAGLAAAFPSQEKRKELCQLWHRLDAWEDVKPGLEALKQLDPPVLLATLSNGTLRLLIDLARHSSLPLDAHFSGDLLGSYKPNPKMYLGACGLLGFGEEERKRGEVAMVASHIKDLKAAAEYGLRTVYVRRSTEDVGIPDGGDAVKTKAEGGEVDIVLDGAGEGLRALAGLLR